jgi:hypothetical protein
VPSGCCVVTGVDVFFEILGQRVVPGFTTDDISPTRLD